MKLKDLGPLGGLQWAGGQEPQRASWSSEGLVEGANEVLKIRGYAKASTCHLKTESKVREKAPSSVRSLLVAMPFAPSSVLYAWFWDSPGDSPKPADPSVGVLHPHSGFELEKDW